MEKVRTIDIKVGDTVKIYQKGRSPFTGIVIKRHAGNSPSATFCVHAVLDGVGVEKIYPLHSPLISRIEIQKRAKVRRAKLYYLRKVVGRVKLKELKSEKSDRGERDKKKDKEAKKETRSQTKTVKAVKDTKVKSRKRTKK